MENPDIMIHPLFHLGPLAITSTVVTTWVIMAILWLCTWLVSRRLSITPGPLQSAIEGMVVAIESAVSAAAPQHARQIMPLIASLWIFLVIANLCGLIPGVHSPTRDLSATAALAILVFLSTHWYGIRIQGLKPYLKHYLSPSPPSPRTRSSSRCRPAASAAPTSSTTTARAPSAPPRARAR